MAITAVDTIVVEALSKYGIKVGNEYVNFSKNLNESEKGKLVPGGTYEVELYVADSGKRYVNKVIATTSGTSKPAVINPVTSKSDQKPVTPVKVSETMTKADWGAKDRSQLIGGLSHDAAMLVAAMVPVLGQLESADAVIKMHKAVLEGLLKNRDEIK